MRSPRRAPAADTDAAPPTSAAHALIVTGSGPSLDDVPSLLEDEHGIAVTTTSDADRSLDRVGTAVDCLVRPYRSVDADPPVARRSGERADLPSVPTVFVCADGIEAARALSMGADRCVRDEGSRAALATHLAAAIRRERDRRDRERDRREEVEFVESVLDTLPDVFFTFDLDDRLVRWNDRLNEVSGYTDAELATMGPADLVAEEDVDSVATAAERALRKGPIRREVTLRTKGGEGIPYEVTSAPLARAGDAESGDDGAILGLCGIGRDITERRERERELRAQKSFTEGVLDAIPDVFYALDDDGQFLRWNDRLNEVTGYSDAELAAMDPLDLVAPEDREEIADAMAIVFGGGEAQTRESELHTNDGEGIPYEFNGSRLTDADGETIGLAGTARDVTERRRRERALRHQAERLETLDSINAVIRDVDRALVRASTREEIEAEVCERLASASPYRFAWIGENGASGVQARAWAGAEEGYLDERNDTENAASAGDGDDTDPVTARTAIRTGEMQVVQHIADDPGCEPWREAALDRGYQSAAAVPLTYRDTTYGVLCVYAPRPNAFDDTEREVLNELGATIAYAISAAERRRALMTDTVIEVELAIRDPSRFLLSLSADLDCHLALEGLVPQADGSLVEFVTIRGASPTAIAERVAAANVEATLVSGGEDGDAEDAAESVFRFVAPGHDASISAALADHGGVVTEATAENGKARIVAEFPADTDVRAVVDALEAKYPDTELLARRERERTDASGARLRSAFADALTDRQHEVLRTAYLGGYFEWPRDTTGEDLATSLGIAKPTFHEHLRAAERKLLTTFFDRRSPEPTPH